VRFPTGGRSLLDAALDRAPSFFLPCIAKEGKGGTDSVDLKPSRFRINDDEPASASGTRRKVSRSGPMPEPTVIVRMKEDGGARPRKAQGLALARLPHALGRFSLLPFLRETFSMFKPNFPPNCHRAVILRSRRSGQQARRCARIQPDETARDLHVAEVR